MTIINSQNLQPDGSVVEIVTIIDEVANTAVSMTKETYDAQQAAQVAPQA
jgi:hypothetical protein